ncbi:hypothetical protein OAH18_00815 [bacterium]|nr:hypothetical protein [bacterium]
MPITEQPNYLEISMRTFVVATLAVACAFVCFDAKPAYARAQYKAAFEKAYPDLKKKLGKKISCAVCHPTKKKKDRNDYGVALAKAIVSKDVGGKLKTKDAAILKKAIEAVAKEKSSTKGKTFGDLIKDGKLPGTDKPAKKKDDDKK